MTFPGTVASLRQMWGRAGRRGRGLAVYVAGEDALDQFFCRHPDEFLDRPVEAAILDPRNEQIHAAHLLCAAHEGPLEPADGATLGEGWEDMAETLVATGDLRRRPDGTFVPQRTDGYPAADVALRSASRDGVVIVDGGSGEILGTVDLARAHSTVHAGAIYLHGGRQFEVAELDLDARRAVVQPFSGDWYTQPKRETDTYIERLIDRRETLGVRLSFGTVVVTDQVLAFQRKRLSDHEAIDLVALDLPATSFVTQALWYEFDERVLRSDVPLDKLLGSLHAAEHSQIAVLPLLAMCDRWDIGGLSTNLHPQTGGATIFIYDGHPGGIGISRRGFDAFEALVDDAHRLVSECPCERGCPSCVQSPKCGNLNEPLAKAGCVELMGRMLARAHKAAGSAAGVEAVRAVSDPAQMRRRLLPIAALVLLAVPSTASADTGGAVAPSGGSSTKPTTTGGASFQRAPLLRARTFRVSPRTVVKGAALQLAWRVDGRATRATMSVTLSAGGRRVATLNLGRRRDEPHRALRLEAEPRARHLHRAAARDRRPGPAHRARELGVVADRRRSAGHQAVAAAGRHEHRGLPGPGRLQLRRSRRPLRRGALGPRPPGPGHRLRRGHADRLAARGLGLLGELPGRRGGLLRGGARRRRARLRLHAPAGRLDRRGQGPGRLRGADPGPRGQHGRVRPGRTCTSRSGRTGGMPPGPNRSIHFPTSSPGLVGSRIGGVSKRLLLLPLLALALAACGSSSDSSSSSSGSSSSKPAANACTKAKLALKNSGTLTVGTDKPAYPPYFADNDPTNGKGFESAVAYAVARQLGFSNSEVQWKTVPFNSSYAPGPKDFDFDINEISITPEARQAGRLLLELLHGAAGRGRAEVLQGRERDLARRPQGRQARRPARHDEPRRRHPDDPAEQPAAGVQRLQRHGPRAQDRPASTRSSSTSRPPSTSRPRRSRRRRSSASSTRRAVTPGACSRRRAPRSPAA